MTEEERQADFIARRGKAVKELETVLQKHEIGIGLILTGLPQAIVPAISYSDLKKYAETNKKAKAPRRIRK